ncbi:MAG: hypothetical protein RLZZ387_2466 [Chloroflexota bacterium]|jgi:hypothetical protein
MNGLLLLVRTPLRRYAVRRDDYTDARLVTCPEDLAAGDGPGRPYIGFELGALLDPADRGGQGRRRALVVPLRRRKIALLVDRVEELLELPAVQPLPSLLHERLSEPWVTGVLLVEGDIVLQLDLRAVARSALLQSQATTT